MDALTVFVAGARSWRDAAAIATAFDALGPGLVRVVVMGRAGAEQLALKEAERRGWHVRCDAWDRFGQKPRLRRVVAALLRAARPQLVFVFDRTGSRDMRKVLEEVNRYGAAPGSRLKKITHVVPVDDA